MPQTTDELRRAIDAALQETGAAGASVALVSKDEVLWSAEFGLADRATKRAVTPETMFRAGSISKCFVALAVLKLVEEGKLKLDDPVRSLVGDVAVINPWEETDPVRLVHLLEHTAGFDDMAMREYLADKPGISLHDALMFRPQTRTSRWPPGRFFSYSNVGAPLAAYAVERAVGKPFEDYIEEEFLKPLGMKTASFELTEAVKKNLATGYRQDGVTVNRYKHIIYRPAGSLVATPHEMASLAQLWLGRGTYRGVRVLSPESIDRMEAAMTNLGAAHGLRVGYGLANFPMFLHGHRWQGHEGGITGYSAICRYSPEHGVGYVVMVNSGDFLSALRIEDPVAGYLSRDWETPTPPTAPLPRPQLEEFAGYYEPVTPRMQWKHFVERLQWRRRFRVEGGGLRASGLGSSRPLLIPANRTGLFRWERDPEAPFAFVREGGELYLVSGTFLSGSFRRLPTWQAWLETGAAAACAGLMLSAVLFAADWIPRKALGRLRDAPRLNVRSLPLAAVMSLGVAAALFEYALRHAENELLLGQPTWLSVGLWAATWVFAATTVAGLVQAVRARRWDVRSGVRWHALAVSLANVVVLAYLAYWGVIGLRTWV